MVETQRLVEIKRMQSEILMMNPCALEMVSANMEFLLISKFIDDINMSQWKSVDPWNLRHFDHFLGWIMKIPATRSDFRQFRLNVWKCQISFWKSKISFWKSKISFSTVCLSFALAFFSGNYWISHQQKFASIIKNLQIYDIFKTPKIYKIKGSTWNV